MSITPYATVTDLGAYLGAEPPADTQRLLARAQELVDATLTSSPYTADANGNPTDATVLAGLNLAVCAQVEYWLANGDELGQLQEFSSFNIEGISVSRGNAMGTGRLCDRSRDALRAAMLLPGRVTTT